MQEEVTKQQELLFLPLNPIQAICPLRRVIHTQVGELLASDHILDLPSTKNPHL